MIKKIKKDLLKNKINLLILVAISFVFFCYCFSYLHYRKHRYLIHRKSYTGDRNIHRIARGDTDKYALLLFLGGKNMDDAFEENKRLNREINFIYYFYYPCSLAEEIIWSIIDGKND